MSLHTTFCLVLIATFVVVWVSCVLPHHHTDPGMISIRYAIHLLDRFNIDDYEVGTHRRNLLQLVLIA